MRRLEEYSVAVIAKETALDGCGILLSFLKLLSVRRLGSITLSGNNGQTLAALSQMSTVVGNCSVLLEAFIIVSATYITVV